jgi:2'-5' RNA ligase
VADVDRAVTRSYRLFIAVAIPPEPLAACRELISAVSSAPSVVAAGGRLRWTRRENLHLTIRFLGDSDPALVPAIGAGIQAAVTAVPAFSVVIAGAGVFPASGSPRALWLGVSDGQEELIRLGVALDVRLAAIGVATRTGPYRPHLTVARAGRGEPTTALAAADALRTAAAGWSTAFDVERIGLYRSHLGSGPPRYEELISIALPA